MSNHALAATCVLLALARTAPAAQEALPIQAIWKTQEITFHLQSFTTFYSCAGLENKLERILRGLGVQARVRVRSPECPSAVARMPRVVLEVTSPVEATPAALAKREQGRATRELAARVRGTSAAEAAALAPFAAQWRRVALTRGQFGLGAGDCDLVEELQRKVLPKLAVRIVQDELVCSPRQVTLGQPRLHVEALTAMPEPDAADKAR